MNEAEKKACIDIINNMDEEMKKFENYHIPSKFFGLGSHFVDYGNTNIIENLSDVNFLINTSG